MMRELCLVLLFDASGSIPAQVWPQVVQAHMDGLRHERVERHARRLGVAVHVIAYGWQPETLVEWQDSPEAAARLLGERREYYDLGGTHTGDAIMAALDALDEAPQCERQVIDLATDGESNGGRPMHEARDAAAMRGVTINVVTVRTEKGAEDPGAWARENAITPGGFVIEASSWREFGRAIVRKLSLEVAGR